MKIMQLRNPNNSWKNGVNQIKNSQERILCLIVMSQNIVTELKHIKFLFFIFTTICHILEWMLLIFQNVLCFLIPLMVSLNIFCSDPHNFLKEIMIIKKKLGKKHKRKLFVAHQNLQKYFMVYQYMPKIFHSPWKRTPAPFLHTSYRNCRHPSVFIKYYSKC